MKKIKLIGIVCCLLSLVTLQAQVNPPVIGQPCPDFSLKNIDGYTPKDVTLKDLKGKYIILGFWSKNCAGCVAAFPRFSRLQEQYRDKGLQIIMVAWDEPLVHPMWETYKKKLNLHIPNVFDTLLFRQMKIEYSGINIWVDKDGIVKAVNTDEDVNNKNISAFIADKAFVSSRDFSANGQEKFKDSYDPLKPMFVNDNGAKDTSYDFRLIISLWHSGEPHHSSGIDTRNFSNYLKFLNNHKNTKVDLPNFLGTDIKYLYQSAYLGVYSIYGVGTNDTLWGDPPLIEVKDTQRYNQLSTQRYNFALYYPISRFTAKNLMRTMQHGLEDYFGYKGVVEYRDIPCLKLIATDPLLAKEKLKVKDSIPFYDTPSDLSWYNWPMKNFCFALPHYLSPRTAIVNGTGITGNISIQLNNVIMTDWHDIQRALKEYGLDLIPSTLHIKTLVIKDVD